MPWLLAFLLPCRTYFFDRQDEPDNTLNLLSGAGDKEFNSKGHGRHHKKHQPRGAASKSFEGHVHVARQGRSS